jgi:very-short-patch-repair endonuclease
MKCNYCEKDINNKGSFKKHLKSCERLEKIKNDIVILYKEGYSINKLSKHFSIGKDIICNLLKKTNGVKYRNGSEAVKLAHKLYPDSFKHSEESKQKMREKRLDWMKKNPEKTSWRKTNLSYPEKLFLEELIKRQLDKKYLTIREKSFYPYFADFTFENFKLVVEIDGSQHLLKERREKDEEKEKIIIKRIQNNKIYRE